MEWETVRINSRALSVTMTKTAKHCTMNYSAEEIVATAAVN